MCVCVCDLWFAQPAHSFLRLGVDTSPFFSVHTNVYLVLVVLFIPVYCTVPFMNKNEEYKLKVASLFFDSSNYQGIIGRTEQFNSVLCFVSIVEDYIQICIPKNFLLLKFCIINLSSDTDSVSSQQYYSEPWLNREKLF